MPFFEAVGCDKRTGHQRSLHISARSDLDAINTAAHQGIAQIKLRPIDDRELLLMDFKCFLNAGPGARPSGHPRPDPTVLTHTPRSLLLEHPILTLTIAMLLALTLNRLIESIPTLL